MEDETMSPGVKAIMDLGTEAGKQIPEFKAVLEAACAHHYTDPESMIIEAMEQMLLLARQADAARIEKLEKSASSMRALNPGWDSYNGQPITEAAIAKGLEIAKTIPQLTPRSNGGVQLDWPDFYELSINPDGSQDFDEAAKIAALEQRVDRLVRALRDIHNSIFGSIAGPTETDRRVRCRFCGVRSIGVYTDLEHEEWCAWSIAHIALDDAALAAPAGRMGVDNVTEVSVPTPGPWMVRALINPCQWEVYCLESDGDKWRIALCDSIEDADFIARSRALHAEHEALWEVVRAADGLIVSLKEHIESQQPGKHSLPLKGLLVDAYNAARANLAALSAEEKEKS